MKAQLDRIERALARLGAADAVKRSVAPVVKRQEPKAAGGVVLLAKLVNRRLEKKVLTDYLWFDVEFRAVGLRKPAAAFDGVLRFRDRGGRTRVSLSEVLTRTIRPGEAFTEKGVGVELKDGWRNDQWLVETPLDEIVVLFQPKSIVYEDGTTTEFGSKTKKER